MLNKYVHNILDKVQEWHKKFNLFAATLDEWIICQKKWRELEKIFSAGDIAK